MEQTTTNLPETNWPPRRVILATLIVLAIAAAFYLFFSFRLVFFSLFIAIVLATAVEPLIDRLSRIGIPRAIGMILISLLVLAAVILLIMAVAPLITDQWATITRLLSEWYNNLVKTLMTSPSLLLQRIALRLPMVFPLSTPAAPSLPATQAGQPNLEMAQQAYNIGAGLLHGLIVVLSVLLLTGLWLLEGEVATRFVLLAIPAARRDSAREFLGDIQRKVGAYTRGLVILSLIVGGSAGVAYAIIGLPNVLFLGVFAGVMEVVPLIGPLLGAIPAVLIAVSTSPDKVIWVIGAYVIIQFAESHFIVPKVMDRAVGVNPVASLLAFIAFGSIFGFVGALLAVPLAAVIQLVLSRFLFNPNPTEQTPPIGRSSISSLRYEAQNLVLDVRKQVREKDAESSAAEDRIEDNMEAIAQDLDSILALAEKDENDNAQINNGKSKVAP